jgi:hypothetical protein
MSQGNRKKIRSSNAQTGTYGEDISTLESSLNLNLW